MALKRVPVTIQLGTMREVQYEYLAPAGPTIRIVLNDEKRGYPDMWLLPEEAREVGHLLIQAAERVMPAA